MPCLLLLLIELSSIETEIPNLQMPCLLLLLIELSSIETLYPHPLALYIANF